MSFRQMGGLLDGVIDLRCGPAATWGLAVWQGGGGQLTLYTIRCHVCDPWCPQGLTKAMRCVRASAYIRGCPRNYASWGDPGYTDQIIFGAPRSYEVAASFKW